MHNTLDFYIMEDGEMETKEKKKNDKEVVEVLALACNVP